MALSAQCDKIVKRFYVAWGGYAFKNLLLLICCAMWINMGYFKLSYCFTAFLVQQSATTYRAHIVCFCQEEFLVVKIEFSAP